MVLHITFRAVPRFTGKTAEIPERPKNNIRKHGENFFLIYEYNKKDMLFIICYILCTIS